MNEVKKPKKPMFFYYIIVLMAIRPTGFLAERSSQRV